MNSIIDSLDRLGLVIIDVLKHKVYYKEHNNQLITDSKQFIPILNNYYKEPEMFLEVLNRILNTWKPILLPQIINLIVNYRNLTISLKNSLIEKQRELIMFSNSLDQEKKIVENELNEVTDRLNDMFSTMGELNTSMKKIPLGSSSKQIFKKPSRRKRS